MMVVVQFIPGAKRKQQQAIQILSSAMNSQRASEIEGSHEFRHEGSVDGAERSLANSIKDTLNEYTNNEPETVVINGKVYPRSPDNIYMINGQRVLYKPRVITDSRKTASEEVSKESSSTESDGLLMSPAQMMDTMKKAQENLKARNQALEDLSKSTN